MIKTKDEKGISLVVLVITVIVIGLFAGIVTYNGINLLRQSQKTAFLQELQIIQEKVNIIYEQIKNGTITYNENYLRDCMLSADDNIPVGKTNSNYEDFRKLDSIEDFSMIGLDDIEGEYYINFKTAEVISKYGFEDGDSEYYNLEDFGYKQSINNSTNIQSRIEENSDQEYEIIVSITYPEGYVCKYSINDENDYKYYTDEFYVDNGTTVYTKISEDGINFIESESKTIEYDRFTTSGIYNEPQIASGMQPVEWDDNANEGAGDWVEISKEDPEWYSYTTLTPKYAHVKLKDGSVFVWIPRFTTNGNEIVYSNGRIDYTNNNYYLNSSFNVTKDSKEKKLLGIWVAVYPASENIEYNLIQSVQQDEYYEITELSQKCQYLKEYTGIYGVYSNEVDSFLINGDIYDMIVLMPGIRYQLQELPNYYSEQNADRPIIIVY